MASHSSILAWKIPWTWTWTWVGYSPWGQKESDTIEHTRKDTHTYTHTHTHENGTKGKRSKGNETRAAINQLINASLCTQPVFNSFSHSPSQYHKTDDTLQMITYVLV